MAKVHAHLLQWQHLPLGRNDIIFVHLSGPNITKLCISFQAYRSIQPLAQECF